MTMNYANTVVLLVEVLGVVAENSYLKPILHGHKNNFSQHSNRGESILGQGRQGKESLKNLNNFPKMRIPKGYPTAWNQSSWGIFLKERSYLGGFLK